MDHVVELRDLAVGVADDREVELRAADLGDVVGPVVVAVDRVYRDGDRLGVALLELVLQRGGAAELGGADRGEVGRVAEEDRPLAGLPVVEVDLAFGRLCGEVGCLVAESVS